MKKQELETYYKPEEAPQLRYYTIEEYFEIEMFIFKKHFENWKEKFDIKLDSITFHNDEFHPDTCHVNFIGKGREKFIYSIMMWYKCCHQNKYGIDWVEERFNEEELIKRIKEIVNEKSRRFFQ